MGALEEATGSSFQQRRVELVAKDPVGSDAIRQLETQWGIGQT